MPATRAVPALRPAVALAFLSESAVTHDATLACGGATPADARLAAERWLVDLHTQGGAPLSMFVAEQYGPAWSLESFRVLLANAGGLSPSAMAKRWPLGPAKVRQYDARHDDLTPESMSAVHWYADAPRYQPPRSGRKRLGQPPREAGDQGGALAQDGQRGHGIEAKAVEATASRREAS